MELSRPHGGDGDGSGDVRVLALCRCCRRCCRGERWTVWRVLVVPATDCRRCESPRRSVERAGDKNSCAARTKRRGLAGVAVASGGQPSRSACSPPSPLSSVSLRSWCRRRKSGVEESSTTLRRGGAGGEDGDAPADGVSLVPYTRVRFVLGPVGPVVTREEGGEAPEVSSNAPPSPRRRAQLCPRAVASLPLLPLPFSTSTLRPRFRSTRATASRPSCNPRSVELHEPHMEDEEEDDAERVRGTAWLSCGGTAGPLSLLTLLSRIARRFKGGLRGEAEMASKGSAETAGLRVVEVLLLVL
jgi:hypothetical protein